MRPSAFGKPSRHSTDAMRADTPRTRARGTAARPTLRRLFAGTPDSIAGTVYGTVVVMGAVTAGSLEEPRPGVLAGVAAATVLVLWLAHVYAHGLGEALRLGRRLDRAELVSVAGRELAIPLAAVVPCSALLLGALGVIRDARAMWLALGLGLLALAVQGVRYARLERLGRTQTAAIVAVNVALGLVIVLLKAIVGH
jgi:hypothetical protein